MGSIVLFHVSWIRLLSISYCLFTDHVYFPLCKLSKFLPVDILGFRVCFIYLNTYFVIFVYLFKFLIFYCCSITVVPIISPLLSSALLTPPPTFNPTLLHWLCPRVLYTSPRRKYRGPRDILKDPQHH